MKKNVRNILDLRQNSVKLWSFKPESKASASYDRLQGTDLVTPDRDLQLTLASNLQRPGRWSHMHANDYTYCDTVVQA